MVIVCVSSSLIATSSQKSRADPSGPTCRSFSPSILLTKRRLAALVSHLLANVGYLGAHLEYDPLDVAPDRKITSRRAPRRQAGQGGQGDTGNAVDQFID